MGGGNSKERGIKRVNAFSKAIGDIIANAESKAQFTENDYKGEDGLIYCGTCHTKKQTRVTLFGRERVVPCLCKCGKERCDNERRERETAERRRRIDDLRKMGFPKSDFERWTFENDDGANEKITEAMRRYVENFPEMRKTGKGLLLYGDVGTGKTFYAACVANALIEKEYPVLMTNFTHIVSAMQESFESAQRYMNRLNDAPLLILDDLGVERNTEYMQEQVYNIIDSRYRSGKPMIITTNLTIEEIKTPANMERKRIYDRILERCFPIAVTGKSRRRQNIRNEYGDMKEMLGL